MCVVFASTQQRAADLFGCAYQAAVKDAVDFVDRRLLGKLESVLEQAAPLREAAKNAAEEEAGAAALESARQLLLTALHQLEPHLPPEAAPAVDSLRAAAQGKLKQLWATVSSEALAAVLLYRLTGITLQAAADALGLQLAGVTWADLAVQRLMEKDLAPALEQTAALRLRAAAAAEEAASDAARAVLQPAVERLVPHLPHDYGDVAASQRSLLPAGCPH